MDTTTLPRLARRALLAPESIPFTDVPAGSPAQGNAAKRRDCAVAVLRAFCAARGVKRTVAQLRAIVETEMPLAREADLARAVRRVHRSIALAAQILTGAEARVAATRRAALAAYKASGLPWPSGGPNEVRPTFRVSTNGAPHAAIGTERGWTRYSARESHVALIDATISLTVSPSWRVSVEARGLAVVDGLLTLAAKRLTDEDGVEVFSAIWCRTGRGHSLVVEHGFIARRGGHTVHAPTLRGALNLLRRQERAFPPSGGDHALLERLAALPADLVVTLDDSVAAGNCATGSRDWTHRYLGGRTKTTVGELVEALRGPARLDRVRHVYAAALQASRVTLRGAA